MSLCYVSCSTLCLNNLFILNPFYVTGVYTTVFKKRWNLHKKNSIHTNFNFQLRDFKLLVMPFTPLSTKITSKIIIYQKNKIREKKNQCCRQQPHKFSYYIYQHPISASQCFTRFNGFKSHFPNTKGSRQSITGKRNPRPNLAN